MKKSLVAVIISLLVAGTWDCKKSPTEVLPTEVLPSPTPVDVFPLAIGSTYRYSYQYENTNRDMSPDDGSSDSGYVQYDILDSVRAADSFRVWTVQESRHMMHKKYWGWGGGNTRSSPVAWLDSTVNWQDSTIVLSLLENLIGMHELRCGGLVWSFPLDSNYFYSSQGWTSTILRMHRYASIASTSLEYDYDDGGSGAWFMNDTVSLEAMRGITSHNASWGGWALTACFGIRLVQSVDPTAKRSSRNQHGPGLVPEATLTRPFESGRRRQMHWQHRSSRLDIVSRRHSVYSAPS